MDCPPLNHLRVLGIFWWMRMFHDLWEELLPHHIYAHQHESDRKSIKSGHSIQSNV